MIDVNDNVILNPDNVVIAEQKGSMYKLTLTNGKILYVNSDVYEDIIAYESGGGGSTTELYEHRVTFNLITMNNTTIPLKNKFYSTSSTPLTKEECYNKIMELKDLDNRLSLWVPLGLGTNNLKFLYFYQDYGYTGSGGSDAIKLDGTISSVYFYAPNSNKTSSTDEVTQVF